MHTKMSIHARISNTAQRLIFHTFKVIGPNTTMTNANGINALFSFAMWHSYASRMSYSIPILQNTCYSLIECEFVREEVKYSNKFEINWNQSGTSNQWCSWWERYHEKQPGIWSFFINVFFFFIAFCHLIVCQLNFAPTKSNWTQTLEYSTADIHDTISIKL